MLTPSLLIPITPFAPIGNARDTPAVSLTRGLPHGIDADILCLGCGDLRHILYTSYVERGLRKSPYRASIIALVVCLVAGPHSPIAFHLISIPNPRHHVL